MTFHIIVCVRGDRLNYRNDQSQRDEWRSTSATGGPTGDQNDMIVMEISPCYCTGVGKATLAFQDEATINRVISAGQDRFTPHDDGFVNSVELIEAIAARGDMTIRVGAYPEPHPDSADGDADVAWLKRKIDAGATSAITQFFFEAETFFRFRDKCDKAGIDVPIIPGILPIQGWAGAKRFAQSCGTRASCRGR